MYPKRRLKYQRTGQECKHASQPFLGIVGERVERVCFKHFWHVRMHHKRLGAIFGSVKMSITQFHLHLFCLASDSSVEKRGSGTCTSRRLIPARRVFLFNSPRNFDHSRKRVEKNAKYGSSRFRRQSAAQSLVSLRFSVSLKLL